MLAEKLLGTVGNASNPNWIDDVFSTYLYTGNNSTQTIANGIDLSTKGGLTWVKARNVAGESNWLFDTVRGPGYGLQSNTINSQANNQSAYNQTFLTNGFSFNSLYPEINASGTTYASWTFAKQEKFFDIVTYTGNSTAGREIPHNLGSAPGCIMVKAISSAGDWWVYHRSLGATQRISLNGTFAAASNINPWNNTEPTSTVFTLSAGGAGNDNGVTYVAYLFAHDAGGFGTAGTDNVISCGSFTTDGSGNATVNLGYEPQYFLTKSVGSGSWLVADNMRGLPAGGSWSLLFPNSGDGEGASGNVTITSTGINLGKAGDYSGLSPNVNYIYIAIRRPMKPPTTGTSVFSPITPRAAATASPTQLSYQTNFPVDMFLEKVLAGSDTNNISRLTNSYLFANLTDAESYSPVVRFDSNNGIWYNTTLASASRVGWMFRRAPTFFDVVCYTGTGVAGRTVTHNLGVAPELMIVKGRSNISSWNVYATSLTANKQLELETTIYGYSSDIWNNTAPTSSVFSLDGSVQVNGSSRTYVAYLFATCAGVSKVGSYTGTGTTQQVDCGFTGGARFVLIKRTDSTGDWYVWDSARGIVAGNDPYLLLNSTAAEVTNTDYVDTYAAGFEISSTAPAAINANGGSYIYLAIA